MAAASQPVTALLTLEEYLHTVYHPDCDFVDGHLEERNEGETKHGVMQMHLGFWFISHQKEWRLEVIAESRTKVSGNRVRIPDVSVVPLDDDSIQEAVRITPPFIAIEILSREGGWMISSEWESETSGFSTQSSWSPTPTQMVA